MEVSYMMYSVDKNDCNYNIPTNAQRKYFLASKLNLGSLSLAVLEHILPSSAGENPSLPTSV
ncbi:Biosynthetic peptidoglycan transglycosylase [Varanus komodoensis]|nr:Biosynthetic peptidoglycan transglycosylase [Varanus komodoensis]